MHDDDKVETCPVCGSVLLNKGENKILGFRRQSNDHFDASRKEDGRMVTQNSGDEKFYQLVEALKDFNFSR